VSRVQRPIGHLKPGYVLHCLVARAWLMASRNARTQRSLSAADEARR